MENKVGFCGFAAFNKIIYFSDVFTGRIVEYDYKNASYEIKCLKAYMDSNSKMQYGKVIIIGSKVYFSPRNATEILIYDFESDESLKIALKCYGEKFGKPLFIDMVHINNKLFFIPGRYPAIVELDLESDNISLHETGESTTLFTNCNVLFDDDNLYIYVNEKNMLSVFNTNDYTFCDIFLKEKSIYALAALEYEDKYLYAGLGEKILVVDKKNKNFYHIDKYIDCTSPELGFGQMILYKDNVFAFAMNQPIIYMVNLKEKTIHRFKDFSWNGASKDIWEKFTKCDVLCANIVDDAMVFYSSMRNSIIEYDFKTDTFLYHDEPKWKNKAEYVNEIRKKDIVLKEGTVSLTDFIETI
jgi:hypothetical protein